MSPCQPHGRHELNLAQPRLCDHFGNEQECGRLLSVSAFQIKQNQQIKKIFLKIKKKKRILPCESTGIQMCITSTFPAHSFHRLQITAKLKH